MNQTEFENFLSLFECSDLFWKQTNYIIFLRPILVVLSILIQSPALNTFRIVIVETLIVVMDHVIVVVVASVILEVTMGRLILF